MRSRRRPQGRVLTGVLLAATAVAFSAGDAAAQDSTWRANPFNDNYFYSGNWVSGVPTGTATFGTSSITDLTLLSTTYYVDGWTFNSGASDYTFTTTANSGMQFNGAGIIVNGGSVAITVNAGSSFLAFSGNSTAGSATITIAHGKVEFWDRSTAGSATITNNASLEFSDSSTAGNATITNNGSAFVFTDRSTAGSATITNNGGGVVQFSGSRGPNNDRQLSAGSIAGAGEFYLGASTLTVGGNDQSTTVSGVISDCGPSGSDCISIGGPRTGGGLTKAGAGTLTLTGANTYTGPTTINAGTLAVNGSITSPTTVNGGGTLGGTGTIFGDVTNAGVVAPGNSIGALTVTGNYVGNNGALAIQSVLGDDSSQTDQLILNGGSGSGHTAVRVQNLGGPGAQTTNGIPIVVAQNGATTTPGAFTLAGPVGAGAYSYLLFQGPPSGGSADEQNSWYLRSNIPHPNNPDGPPIPLYRPEVPHYAVVAGMARSLAMTTIGTFHERNGDQGLVRGGSGTSDRAWGRLFGQITEHGHAGTVNGRFDGHAGGVQSGVDVYRTDPLAGYQSRLGFLGSYGRAQGDVSGFALGQQNAHAGRTDIDAYSVGGYWTQMGAPGWYIDAVVMGTRYEGSGTAAAQQGGTRTRGHGFAASLEAGYPIPLGAGIRIEPQAQFVYQHLALDDTHDGFSHVAHDTSHGFAGRFGLRLAGDTVYAGARVSPYLKASVWQDWTGADRVVFAGVDVIEARHRGTSLEVGGGIVAQLANNVGLWAAADYTTDVAGHTDRQSVRGNAGVRVIW